MSTALVLGAGGLVGQAFHLGVLSALHERAGFDARTADVLVGTSAGSLVVAALAGGLSAPDATAQLLGRPLSEQGRRLMDRAAGGADPVPVLPDVSAVPVGPGVARVPDGSGDAQARHETSVASGGTATHGRLLAPGVVRHLRPGVRPGAVAAGLLPPGRQPTDGIARAVRRLHGERWPDRDVRICVVRARDGQRVVLTGGSDFGSAVAASCAVPAYFAPVRIDGETYVDGGVHSPTNADVVLVERPDLVIVLSPMTAGRDARRPRLDSAVRLAVRRYLSGEVRRLRAAGSRVVVLQPCDGDLDVMGANPMRGAKQAAVLAQARLSTLDRLDAQPGLLAA